MARVQCHRVMLAGYRRGMCRHEAQTRGGAFACSAVNLELRAVAPYHAVDHRKPQSCAPLALGGVKGLETATPRFLIHSHSRVGDLNIHYWNRIPVRLG